MMEWSRPFTSKFPFSSNSIFFPFMVVLQRGRRHYILHAMLRFMSDALPAAVVVCILAMTKFAFYGISHIACMQYTYPSCYTPPICWGLYTIWQEISKISWQLSQWPEYKNSSIGSSTFEDQDLHRCRDVGSPWPKACVVTRFRSRQLPIYSET